MWIDDEETRRVLRSLTGERLREVHYLLPAEMAALPGAERVHEVDHGVRLITTYPVMITLMWQMEGDCAALLAVEGTGHDEGITDLIDAYDVSGNPLWKPLIGRTVTGAGLARHRPHEDCPATPWSYRFELGDRDSFVVALAEVHAGTLTYTPANVAVLFDRRDAERLYAPVGDAPAWGTGLTP